MGDLPLGSLSLRRGARRAEPPAAFETVDKTCVGWTKKQVGARSQSPPAAR